MVFIIDGNHLAARCYFAIDPLTTENGKSTSVIFGFINSLYTYVKRFGLLDNYYCITWDSEGPKERHKLYPDYKANRKKFPDEFYEQISDIRTILKCLPVEQYKIEATEADDIIGTITLQARKKGQKVLIISSDHDFEQLISKHVRVLSPSLAISKEKLKNSEFVIEKYGIEPKQLIELMALVGDGTDNINGVEGIGEKTAVNLLKVNGGLNNLLANVEDLKTLAKDGTVKDASSKMKEKIAKSVERIKLNRLLVEINCHLDISISFDKHKAIQLPELKEQFKKLEFNKFIKELDLWQKTFSR